MLPRAVNFNDTLLSPSLFLSARLYIAPFDSEKRSLRKAHGVTARNCDRAWRTFISESIFIPIMEERPFLHLKVEEVARRLKLSRIPSSLQTLLLQEKKYILWSRR